MTEKIEYEICYLQRYLAEVILMLNYLDSIAREQDLQAKYPQFTVIGQKILENILIRTASIIENRNTTKFNIIKPINRILNDGIYKEKYKEIRLVEIKIKERMSDPIAKALSDLRDKYLAHNDLHNRQNMEIVPDEIRKYSSELFALVNKAAEIIGIPTFLAPDHPNLQLDNIFEKLKS